MDPICTLNQWPARVSSISETLIAISAWKKFDFGQNVSNTATHCVYEGMAWHTKWCKACNLEVVTSCKYYLISWKLSTSQFLTERLDGRPSRKKKKTPLPWVKPLRINYSGFDHNKADLMKLLLKLLFLQWTCQAALPAVTPHELMFQSC